MLRTRNEEIAEDLNARDVLHFLWIDEKAFERRHCRMRDELNEPVAREIQIIRQNRNANAGFPPHLAFGTCAWIRGSSPRMTRQD